MNQPTVMITGASRGIGRATAEIFAEQGYRLLLNYLHSEEAAHELENQLKNKGADVMLYQADVADEQQVACMVAEGEKRFGAIDVLVSNAGIAGQRLFTDITPEEWRRMMAVHVDGAFHCCRSVLPGMIRRKQGKIILVSSIWGLVGGSCEVHYSTAKAALIGMTKALAKEVGPSNIQVNCIAPGVIDTEMNGLLDAQTRTQIQEETPLGRMGTPREVAQAIAFLASPQADFITGQILSPNGGFVI